MSDSPFKVIGNRNNDGALNWIKFTIDIALNILRIICLLNYNVVISYWLLKYWIVSKNFD
jgi:hypothetical protein